MEKLKYEKPALKSLTGGEYLSFAAQCAPGTTASYSCDASGGSPQSTCFAGGTAVGNCNVTGGDTLAPSCGAGTTAS